MLREGEERLDATTHSEAECADAKTLREDERQDEERLGTKTHGKADRAETRERRERTRKNSRIKYTAKRKEPRPKNA